MASGEEGFVRRIAAMLVAERDADPASQGNAEDALVRALALLREARGDAERFAAGAVVAGFDHVVTAIDAALRLHAEMDEWRIGVDVGEVVMTADGAATTRAAIERATALARVARRGTTAVDAGALASVGALAGATLEALPEQTAYLIVPTTGGPSLHRRRLVTLLGAAAVVGTGAAVFLARHRLHIDVNAERLTLGVGPFRSSRTDPEHAWIGDALRTGLNTELSQLSGVKVYSQEFLDFVMSNERLSEIELATRLGMQKMLTGTVLVTGDGVHVEAQIIDVATGLLEGAYVTTGREERFLALKNDVVLGVIGKLGLRLSAEDEQRLAARLTSDPDVFQRFFDTEGAGRLPAPPPPSEPGRWEPPSGFLGPRAAYADDGQAAISALLEAYRRAIEARDVPALAGMYLQFAPELRVLLERYFASARDLRVHIDDVDIAVAGDKAVASYTRIDDFVDIATQRPQHLSVRVTRRLRRVNDQWRFESVK